MKAAIIKLFYLKENFAAQLIIIVNAASSEIIFEICVFNIWNIIFVFVINVWKVNFPNCYHNP